MAIEIIDAAADHVGSGLDVLSNWAANAALQEILPPGCHLAAFLSDPSPLGNIGAEVAGGGYQRQPIGFGPAANRTRVSTNAQIFPGMPACLVRYLAVMTALAGGHMVFAKRLATPISVLESGQLLVAAGDIAIGL
jgi:hypothetical protein